MVQTNPLIISGSPRDIPEVRDITLQIQYDKLLAKYYSEADAYRLLQNFFLEHKEYTHAVICPDDLVVDPTYFNVLKWDVEQLNPPYLAGICPLQWGSHQYACGMTPAHEVGPYHYMEDRDIEYERARQKSPILRVMWEGFACAWIRRDVLEKISLRAVSGSMGFDVAFSYDCINHGIPQYVDSAVKLVHLKNKPFQAWSGALDWHAWTPGRIRTIGISHPDRHLEFYEGDNKIKEIK